MEVTTKRQISLPQRAHVKGSAEGLQEKAPWCSVTARACTCAQLGSKASQPVSRSSSHVFLLTLGAGHYVVSVLCKPQLVLNIRKFKNYKITRRKSKCYNLRKNALALVIN